MFVDSTYYASISVQIEQTLKAALNEIIDGHVFQTKSCLWTILAEADEDPTDDTKVIGLYTRRSIHKTERDMGGNTPDAWNREHVWASSHGFSNSLQHGHTDAHHLRVSDKSVNADRQDHDFGYAPAPGGIADSECTDCREDVFRGVWEAPDSVKGDIARMMFYVDTRYDGGDTLQTNTPDVSLVTTTTSPGSSHGLLCELVDWHLNDTVSQEERVRNDVIYSWQGNRNPFIDHPEYVVRIWGPQCGLEIPPLAVPTQIPMLSVRTRILFIMLVVIYICCRGFGQPSQKDH